VKKIKRFFFTARTAAPARRRVVASPRAILLPSFAGA
jgi:hypothetical protein